jgi:hypothetical protein
VVRRASSAFSLLLLPGAARACTVCFGAMGPDLTRGFYWGVMLLILLPPVMILGFVGVIAYHARKHRRLQQDPAR